MTRPVEGQSIEIGAHIWHVVEVVAGKDGEGWTVRAQRQGDLTWAWVGGTPWNRDVESVMAVNIPGVAGLRAKYEGSQVTVFEIEAPPEGFVPFEDALWWQVDGHKAMSALMALASTLGALHAQKAWLQGVRRRELWLHPQTAELFLVGVGRLAVARKPPIEAAWRDMRIIGELAYEIFAQEAYPGGHEMAAILQDKGAMANSPILFPGLAQLLAGCVSPYGDLAYVDTKDLREGLRQLRTELERPLTFSVGSASTVGNYLFRKNNQDSCGYLVTQSICGSQKVSLGFFCVADGIGGISDGEHASRLAVETATQAFSRAWAHYGAEHLAKHTPALARSIAKVVGQRLAIEGELRPNNNRGGTTFSGMVLCGARIGVCHVGDSRIVLMRDNEVHQLTHDHTLANILVQLGELTREEAEKNDISQRTISRFLSTSAEVELDRVDGFGLEAAALGADLNEVGLEVRRGDLFILTSDGAHGEIDEEGLHVLAERHRDDPQTLADKLVQNAIDRMGRDNSTALVVLVE